jgi:hypothetical protein
MVDGMYSTDWMNAGTCYDIRKRLWGEAYAGTASKLGNKISFPRGTIESPSKIRYKKVPCTYYIQEQVRREERQMRLRWLCR